MKRLNKLLGHRENLNLTQEELAKNSGISVRTIQRIESGVIPKGHTLKVLATALNISENELLEENNKQLELNYSLIKIINLSSLPFVILPVANIAIPLIIMFAKKQFNPITKQIISLQIIWLILSAIIFMLSSFIKNWFSLSSKFSLIIMVLLILTNMFIILINAIEIDKNQKLHIKLNFNLI